MRVVLGKNVKPLKYIGLIIQLGASMALPVVVGVIAGKHLDNRLGTGNILLVISVTLGIYISFANLYRQAKK